ncbi:Carnitine O-acetyltransferase [Oopsacas minuta]|uniref:Carnitine O-acetyltransferase n=1 Tax=Oopsacas minuta TaxID=111878 RepID=A0AAV7KKL8_9METZ|nr:Carnitine O-acetyltransferase [Oopsacas minuta]
MTSHKPFPKQQSTPILSHVPASAMALPFLSTRSASTTALFTSSGIPRLPVPPLEETLDKYLQVVRPLLSPDQFSKTQKIVEGFRTGAGPDLQKALQERAKVRDSWLHQWWLECAYLGFRLPVVVHSSPGVSTFKQEFSTQNQLVSFCSKVVRSALEFHLDVLEDRLPPDLMGSVALDMSQYSNILASTRIPEKDIDSQRRPSREQSRHILVIHQGRFFKLPVFNREGVLATREAISSQIEAILRQSDTPCKDKVGILTSLHRDKLVTARQELINTPTNVTTLEQIETAIFTLCIDNPTPLVSTSEISHLSDPTETTASRITLHGYGSSVHSANRWFDSGVQFLVGKDGYFGMNYEHSNADAPPVIKLFDKTIAASQEPSDVCACKDPLLADPEELLWEISAVSQQHIAVAREEMDSLVADTDVQCFLFKEFGKDLPKSYRLSPDSFFQVALQLAYYKMHTKTPATYESGSTRKFYQGRTETIRSATMASLEFVQAFTQNVMSNEKLAHLLRQAVEAHRSYTIEAVNGQGVDRHLLGLKLISKEKGVLLPEIFSDPTYSHSLHITLSTSQVPSQHQLTLCFGPVVPDGYGVCYNPRENEFRICVSTFRSCPTTSTAGMIKCIEESLMQMQHTLYLGQPAKL